MDHWGMYERLLGHAAKARSILEDADRIQARFRADRALGELRQVVTADGKYVPSGAAPVPVEAPSAVADRASSLVPLDRESIQGYLDTAIASWRHQRDSSTDEGDRAQAVYYVDAFQSVRSSLLGDVLPPAEGGASS